MNRPGRFQRWARGCPPAWQITRAISEDDGRFAAHIETCPICAAEYHRLRELVVRAGVLATTDGMSQEIRQAISARLLGGPSPRAGAWRFLARPLWLGKLGAGTIAVSLCLGGVWGLARWNRSAQTIPSVTAAAPGSTAGAPIASSPGAGFLGNGAPRSRASIRAVDAARFSRVASPPDERILLQEGVIALDVVALAVGERFRVMTEDAEVEVRGTQFEVSASRGRLTAVRVTTGRVEVKSSGGALATLDAGDEWVVARPASSSSSPARPTAHQAADQRLPPAPDEWVAARPASSSSSPARPTARQATDQRLPPAPDVPAPPRARHDRNDESRRPRPTVAFSFENAWSLLRKGDTQAAAAAFAEVERVAAGSALEEDASYWRAVAVARSGSSLSARGLFGEFLRRFPTSSRRGEASVALGWLLLEAGQPTDARAAFELAASDPSARVRASAREGQDHADRAGRAGRR